MNAWLFQDTRQKKKLGEDDCPWSVGWYDPDGYKKSKRVGSKSLAQKYLRRIEGQLAAGTYSSTARKTWDDFWSEYDSKVLEGASAGHRKETKLAVKHFERLVNPKRLQAIKSQTFDDYATKRLQEDSRRREATISPATVNKELRHLKLVMSRAVDWGYIGRVPRIHMIREPEKLKRYVIPDHFALLYEHCDAAGRPTDYPFTPADWWRGVIVFGYMTGWRIGEILALRREDLDLEAGTAITRHGDNKGKRDEIVPLNDVVVEHLRPLRSFEPVVFPFYHSPRTLYQEFHAIQKAAGLAEPYYGFHDLRRAFATMNVARLSAVELQRLMRHKSFETTKRYIDMAQSMNRVVDKLHVPDVLLRKG
jgi:integrase